MRVKFAVTKSFGRGRGRFDGGRRVAKHKKEDKRMANRISRHRAEYVVRMGQFDEVADSVYRLTNLD